MSGNRILWGQITLVLAVVLATTWTATQWTAWRLGFQPQLGQPWFELAPGMPVYYPPAFFWWWYAYDAYAPSVFIEGAFIAASGGFIAIAVAITLSILRAREAKNVETYGSARWASNEEIRKAGLLGPDGVILGCHAGHYLRHDGPEHVLCFAPTRSGKGVGLVVPTLLTWPGSCIVHDIKGENWTLTAGLRSRFGRVLKFDPTDARSAAYNPLLEVRRGDKEVRDVQNIADILVDPEGALERRNHWEKTSHCLLVGAILHVLYAEPDKTLAGVANFLSDPRAPGRSDAARDDVDTASRRGRRSPRRRLRRPRTPEQSGQRTLGRALHRDVVSRPLPRSRGGQGDGPLRLAHRRSDRASGAGQPLPRGAALRHQPHQAADPVDPQSDRAAAHRGIERQRPPASSAADARRVSRARDGWIFSSPHSPSWPVTASRAS